METTYLGYLAGTLTSLCSLPQVYKIWKTKEATDVSYKMFFTLSIGVFLWIIFGYLKNEMSIVVTNAISFILNILIIMMKWRFESKRD